MANQGSGGSLAEETNTRRSAYYAVIGDPPVCGPGDHASALAYLHKIELAIMTGGWSEYEAIRLKRLEARWRRRAFGRDPRFELVGTRVGRLSCAEEFALMPAQAKARDEELREKRRGRLQDQRRNPERRWRDADQPTRPAKGGTVDADQWADIGGDDELGDLPLPAERTGPRQYLIPGQDTKGHSQRIYCRVMPAHYRALCAIERSKVFGFRTIGDLMRWCIDFGLRELTQRAKIPQAVSAIAQVEAIREILLDEQYYMDFGQLFEQMTTTINRHLSAGAEGEAIRVIAMVRHHIEQFSESYWRDKYMGELMRQYGPYLDGTRGEGASFGAQEAREDE